MDATLARMKVKERFIVVAQLNENESVVGG
jgi:hypothetical protein